MDKVQNSWARTAVIGKGSFGTVSLAVNKSNGAVFAVKSVHTNSSLPFQIEALENEIRILRSLSSPYLVKYLGDDVTVETPSMTSFRNLHMEYLPGGTVADGARAGYHLSCGGGVDERIIKNYTFCIVSGLKYLHSEGIVHCDIKGENVLVGPTPGTTAKLADLGSAMEIRGGKNYTNIKTSNNKIMPRGSPLWMAPEVVRGEYQGPESDVWSLGCTVIEMVTGKPVWEDKGAAETLCRIGYSDELPRLPTQLSELGRDFVEKCLRREVKERWSCDQLLQHPFISMCSPSHVSNHSSPRCVLDLFSLDSDEEEDEEEKPSSTSTSTICECSQVKGRIGKLASGGGAIWESDGWVEVRSTALSGSDAGCCGSEGEGTSSEYQELIGIEGEFLGAESEYKDSMGIAEFSGRTSGQYLPVDSNCSAVVEVRYDSHNNGVVTDSDDSRSGLESHSQAGDSSHWSSTSQFLALFYYLFLMFYRFDETTCSQFLDSITYKRKFCYISFCVSVGEIQLQSYFNFGNFHKSLVKYNSQTIVVIFSQVIQPLSPILDGPKLCYKKRLRRMIPSVTMTNL